MSRFSENDNPNNLKVIETARNKEAINGAIAKGFRPLIKRVEPSGKIHSKFAVFQKRTTGEIDVISDFRSTRNDDWDFLLSS